MRAPELYSCRAPRGSFHGSTSDAGSLTGVEASDARELRVGADLSPEMLHDAMAEPKSSSFRTVLMGPFTGNRKMELTVSRNETVS